MVDGKIIQPIPLDCLSADIKIISPRRGKHTDPTKPVIVFSTQIFQTVGYYFQHQNQRKINVDCVA